MISEAKARVAKMNPVDRAWAIERSLLANFALGNLFKAMAIDDQDEIMSNWTKIIDRYNEIQFDAKAIRSEHLPDMEPYYDEDEYLFDESDKHEDDEVERAVQN